MQFRNNIINAALLGTDKNPGIVSDLPEALKPVVENIEKEEPDAENKFLKTTALALNYYRAGIQPLKLTVQPDEAPAEQLDYCSPEAAGILKEILGNKYNTLILFWCKQCSDKNRIVHPQYLPELLEWGISAKNHNADVFRSVIGNRGLWLSKFSGEWAFISGEGEPEDWETGNIQQRVKHIERLRRENPQAAIEKLQAVWKEENAANKVELIDTLKVNISNDDEEFLNTLLRERSQKVKDKAWQLLKRIPDSEIILKYRQILQNSIHISQGKMLGLINKTNINISLTLPGEEIFQTGIQNLSNNKKISDDDFILMQLIAEVSPEFWETHFNSTPAEAIKLFATKDNLVKFQASLCEAVIKFRNKTWSKEILDQFGRAPVALLQMLGEEEMCSYAEKFLNNNLYAVINILRTHGPKEWPLKFTRQILAKTTENPNAYNKNFYESICTCFPPQIINDLDKFSPSEEWKKGYWKNLSQEIKELITIKEKIKNTI